MIRSLLLLLAGVGPAPAPKPRLVVVITVDQLRPDYLDRYRPQLKGGFAMLLKTGASFTDAYQDHAVTETAPGHSTILSGRSPMPSRPGSACSTGSAFPSAPPGHRGPYSSRSGTTLSPTASPTRIRDGKSYFPTVSRPTAGKRRSPSSRRRRWTRSRSPSPSKG